MNNHIYCLITLFFISCIPIKKLEKDRYLLYKQQITGLKNISKEEITPLFLIKENKKVLGLPILFNLYLYLIGKQKLDKNIDKKSSQLEFQITKKKEKSLSMQKYIDSLSIYPHYQKTVKRFLKKIKKNNNRVALLTEKKKTLTKNGNWLMRISKETPAYYDEKYIEKTVELMKKFFFKKGYFHTQIKTEVDTMGRLIGVEYQIKENIPFKINEIRYDVENPTIGHLFSTHEKDAYIKKDAIFDEEMMEKERNRLYQIISNEGYYYFSKNNLLFTIDTFLTKKKYLDIDVNIVNVDSTTLQKSYIGDVSFELIDTENNYIDSTDRIFVDDISFSMSKKRISRLLSKNIYFMPGDIHREKDREKTLKNLSQMDMFKFVNTGYREYKDTIDVKISATPLEKYQYSIELGTNLIQNQPGPFSSLSFKIRNFLGYGDVFQISGQYALMVQTGALNTNNTFNQEFRINSSLRFPTLFLPWKPKSKKNTFTFLPSSVIQLNLSDIQRPEYSKLDLQLSFAYKWIQDRNKNFELKFININVVNMRQMTPIFREQLEKLAAQGSNLIYSFDDYIISSVDGTFLHSVYDIDNMFMSNFFKIHMELSGAYINLFNLVSNNSSSSKIFNLTYAEYFLFSTTYVNSFKINKNNVIVGKINVGITTSLRRDKEIPYQKNFFTGGTSSNRGWMARRIGPGSYAPVENELNIESPGNLLFEANMEFRKKIVKNMNIAFFLDMSNVWNLKKDPTAIGADFTWSKAWRELYMSSGIGFRWDLFFLVLRMDIGYPIYNPSLPLGEQFLLSKLNITDGIFNFAIGYPF